MSLQLDEIANLESKELEDLIHDIFHKAAETTLESGDLKLANQLIIGESVTNSFPEIEKACIDARNRQYKDQQMLRNGAGKITILRLSGNSTGPGENISLKLSKVRLDHNGYINIIFTATSLNDADFGTNYGTLHFWPEKDDSKIEILRAIKTAIDALHQETMQFTTPFNREIDKVLASI